MLDELVGIRILPRYSDGADLYRIKSIDSEGFYHSEVVEFSSNSIDFVEDETTFDDFMCQDVLLISDEVFENVLSRVKSSIEVCKSKMMTSSANSLKIEKGACLISEKKAVRLGYKDQNNGKWECEALQITSNSALCNKPHSPMSLTEDELQKMTVFDSEHFDNLVKLVDVSVEECLVLVA